MSVQSSSKTSITQRFDSYQPSKTLLVWACVVTAIATMIIGFSWGGWVTGGTSSKAAAAMATLHAENWRPPFASNGSMRRRMRALN